MSSSSKELSLEMSKYLMNWHQNRNGKCVFPPEGGVSSSSNKERNKDGGEGGASGISPLFHLPAEFFHPAGAVIPAPPRSRSLRLTRGLRLTSPASWASLRSPGTHSKMLCTQVGGGEGHSAFTKEVRWEHDKNDGRKSRCICFCSSGKEVWYLMKYDNLWQKTVL